MASESAAPGEQGSKSDEIPREGDLVAGKYRVERVLGRGGMGVVVAARHAALRQRVAIKFLLPEATKLDGASERFLREAQAAAAIQNEHVAKVIDIGTLESGSPYMVMEYLTGTDLSDVLRSRGRLPVDDAVDYILQACEAIAEAHALGIVHRDLKPGNLFLSSRQDGSPLVKVLDFGLSKVISSSEGLVEASLTATQMVVGSPFYMSPEQMRSLKHVDARTDVWSLGVILYQFLAGRRPFEADSLPAVFAKIAADSPTPLRELRPEVPVELETVILRCLEKNLDQRVKSTTELAHLLAPFGPERSRQSVEQIARILPDETTVRITRSSVPDAGLARESTISAAATWAYTKGWPGRGPKFVLASGAALAFAAVAAVALLVPTLGGGRTGEHLRAASFGDTSAMMTVSKAVVTAAEQGPGRVAAAGGTASPELPPRGAEFPSAKAPEPPVVPVQAASDSDVKAPSVGPAALGAPTKPAADAIGPKPRIRRASPSTKPRGSALDRFD